MTLVGSPSSTEIILVRSAAAPRVPLRVLVPWGALPFAAVPFGALPFERGAAVSSSVTRFLRWFRAQPRHRLHGRRRGPAGWRRGARALPRARPARSTARWRGRALRRGHRR